MRAGDAVPWLAASRRGGALPAGARTVVPRALVLAGAMSLGGLALAQDGPPASGRAGAPVAAAPAARAAGAYGWGYRWGYPWAYPSGPSGYWQSWPGTYAGWCHPLACGGPWLGGPMQERQRRFDDLRNDAATPMPTGLATSPWGDAPGRYLPPPTPDKQIQPAYRDRSVVRPEFRDSGQARP